MQQTNKYKLNKPGLDDSVAIAPLNENMDKLEAALIAEAKSRADADTAEANARNAAIQDEAAARVSAVNAEISARTAAVNAEASTRANADTTETNARVAADKAEAKTRADADTAETNARIAAVNAEATTRANADTALSQRVTALEAKRFACGVFYDATLDPFTVGVGFTPLVVIIHYVNVYYSTTVVAVRDGQPAHANLWIVDGGFQYTVKNINISEFGYYTYVAFG